MHGNLDEALKCSAAATLEGCSVLCLGAVEIPLHRFQQDVLIRSPLNRTQGAEPNSALRARRSGRVQRYLSNSRDWLAWGLDSICSQNPV